MESGGVEWPWMLHSIRFTIARRYTSKFSTLRWREHCIREERMQALLCVPCVPTWMSFASRMSLASSRFMIPVESMSVEAVRSRTTCWEGGEGGWGEGVKGEHEETGKEGEWSALVKCMVHYAQHQKVYLIYSVYYTLTACIFAHR